MVGRGGDATCIAQYLIGTHSPKGGVNSACLFQRGCLPLGLNTGLSLSCSSNWRHKFLLLQPQLHFSGKCCFTVFATLAMKRQFGAVDASVFVSHLKQKMCLFLTYLGFKGQIMCLKLLTFW